MIDHTGIGVASVERSGQFYDSILSVLGMKRAQVLEDQGVITAIGYGSKYPVFWIDIFHPHSQRYHTGFLASSKDQVDEFYRQGIAAGGRDNGRPGPRMGQSTATYYAAFLFDPDGNNIEAVFRG